MTYDFIIKNGKVFESEVGTFSQKDVYVKDGQFVESGDGEAKQIIDAMGKYVVPGLIDEHAHLYLYGTIIGANADTTCIPSGITTAVDGGTTGAGGFEQFYKSNIINYETSVYSYLNVSTFGNKSLCKHEEDHDPEDFREDLILKMFQKYPNVLRGLKVRMCAGTLGNYGMAPLYKTIEISEHLAEMGYKTPVVVHYGDLPSNVSVDELFSALRPGDIVAHVYQTHGETIFEKDGKVKESVRKAQERGVILDSCNGRVHWSFENLRQGFSGGIYPDIISSDLVRVSEYTRPGFSLLHAMCVFSAAGMKVENILKAVTYNPAKVLGILDKAGVIRKGNPADVAILDITENKNKMEDMFGGEHKGEKMFVPLLTMKNGRVAYRQIFY
ncbi:amidohydrolase family protein [Lachnospiraceae bacterium OttesenSCG-928-E19]|nr:amidohydrolase family protein [Lachnospiraceae bacterium OttesenSCG-928-E19]